MARGRMIANDITRDKRIHELSDDTSRLAFTWLITFADRDGRTYGDPAVVRSMLFPRREDISIGQMEAYIQEWHDLELITWYEADGDLYIWFPGFEKNQPGLRKDREPKSELPSPFALLENGKNEPEECRQTSDKMPETIRQTSGKHPAESRQNDGLREVKRREEKRSESTAATDDAAVDSAFAEIVRHYENNIGLLTPAVREKIIDSLEDFPAERILEAINRACLQNKRSWAYVQGILKRWRRDGYDDDGRARASPNPIVAGSLPVEVPAEWVERYLASSPPGEQSP